MDVSEFTHSLRDRLCPDVYRDGTTNGVAPFTLFLRTGYWLTARYALAVLPWEALESPGSVLSVARRATRKRIFTIPFFAQVGLYLIVVGPKTNWADAAKSLRADQSSLHAVIVQAIHFLDLSSGDSVVHRSKWGPVRFGGTSGVSRQVAETYAKTDRSHPIDFDAP